MASIKSDVLAVLDRGRADGALYFLPSEQLDRGLYVQVNKVLELAGGKWSRKDRAHRFDADAADALEPIFLTGEIADTKKEYQFFETPVEVAIRVVDAADIRLGMRVLEPSAGRGRLAVAARNAGAEVTCVELQGDLVGYLVASLGFADTFGRDFLDTPPAPLGLFDRVVMNPPFRSGQDARHVVHALRFLKPGGRLAAIMSASAMYRETGAYRELRATLANLDHDFEALPDGAFIESGTAVNTALLTVRA